MIKLITIVLVAVVLVSAGFLSVKHYNEYKNNKQHDTAVAQKAASEAQAKEQASATAERAKIVKEYDALRLECEKGQGAYYKLTPAVAKTTPAPVCKAAL